MSSAPIPDDAPRGRLRGRRIAVTGAASGIGRATALLFAQEGASLALLDRDPDGLKETAQETVGSAFEVDITAEDEVAAAAERAAVELGGIDGVVNAAGIMFRGLAADVPAADWRRVLEVNLTGTYLVTRSFLPWLTRETAASVVNIASGQGLLPNSPGYTAYAASKGGIVALTKALAAELAPRIRVNCIAPGMVDTAMADGHRDAAASTYALQRIADPTEIAASLLFLTSTDASYVTGSVLGVDGGRAFH
ncbi:SDR family NAD(P)-dependent oxidoreductase [Streptomyces sp. NBC_01446]|uniref:SDR family NAD(P)-dependent oxidoreductase n=1 Tax=Streptomyces sp. NBC_01446 TaxID=2903870 RepID=UPI00225B9C54|nr:SDR family NAD(P)-dependent oxidoreductase [Streptomyces sp. NBC_01446]MCX4647038.1 SDR family oxidoreductase [Streptomyces sp. NBC_01446]